MMTHFRKRVFSVMNQRINDFVRWKQLLLWITPRKMRKMFRFIMQATTYSFLTADRKLLRIVER